MPLSWLLKMAVPDVLKCVVKTDTFEAMIKADGPVLFQGKRR